MKKLFIVFTVVLLFGGTAFAFAWWDNLEQSEEITIGVGDGVTLEVALGTDDEPNVLVPAGVVSQPGQIDEYVLTYTVTLDQTIDEMLDLTVEASNIKINGLGTLGDDYVNVVITNDNADEIENDPVTITVKVTLDMPSETDASDVKNQPITFDLSFEATQKP